MARGRVAGAGAARNVAQQNIKSIVLYFGTIHTGRITPHYSIAKCQTTINACIIRVKNNENKYKRDWFDF